MDFNKLIQRVKSLLTSPKTEWPVIAEEPATVASLYTGYILILAAVPAVCSFIKSAFIGHGFAVLGTFRMSIGMALTNAVFSYIVALVAVFIVALIVDALAPTFGGQKNRVQALKTVAYAYTASWIAGIGMLVPGIYLLILLAGAVYSIYLLYLGLPSTMKSVPEKSAGYTALTVVIAVVLSWVLALVVGGLTLSGSGMMGGGSSVFNRSGSAGSFDKNSPLGKLETWGKQMEAAGKKMEAAEKSGDKEAQKNAMGEAMGALFSGGAAPAEALEPARLKGFAPESLDGLPRSSVSAQRNAALGMQVSSVNATYQNDQGRDLRLEITDAGGARGFLAMSGWAGLEEEKETSTGYEKTYHADGRMVHEQWDHAHNSGEYGIVLGERFMVKVQGQAASIDALKGALAQVDLSGLEALKSEGVKASN